MTLAEVQALHAVESQTEVGVTWHGKIGDLHWCLCVPLEYLAVRDGDGVDANIAGCKSRNALAASHAI